MSEERETFFFLFTSRILSPPATEIPKKGLIYVQ